MFAFVHTKRSLTDPSGEEVGSRKSYGHPHPCAGKTKLFFQTLPNPSCSASPPPRPTPRLVTPGPDTTPGTSGGSSGRV